MGRRSEQWGQEKTQREFNFHVLEWLFGHKLVSLAKEHALSSCEAEFLAAAGRSAEAIQIKELWTFLSKRPVLIRAITDSSSCRAFSERLGVGRLKHIDARYLWMQLEVKKGTLVMDSIPTLWNVADLGTKRLSKLRREFLMFLIGIVELHGGGSDETFSKVGEEAFNQEVAKKVMAKQMKQVKREMVSAVIEGTANLSAKIPTSMVKMVTLLLLQPVAFGGEGDNGYDDKNVQYTKSGGWEHYLMMIIYSLIVFAFGICCVYAYRLRVGIFLRTLARFVRQERTMELQRERDHMEALENYREYRGMIMRSMMAGVPGGEWQPGPRPPWPEPLRPENADPDRILSVQLREEENTTGEEPTGANSRPPENEPEEEEFEPGEDDLSSEEPEGAENMVMDWNPELGRMQNYRWLRIQMTPTVEKSTSW